MGKKVILLGPYPPPYGGVSIYISVLFEFLKNRGVELWTYGDQEIKAPRVTFMRDKRRELVPLLLRGARRARIADCTHFLVEYPSILVPVWVALKSLLGFEWVKIMQDGSLPSRYTRFSAFRKTLFRLATKSVDEFIVISEELETWLRDEIKVEQKISLIKNLFPVSYRDADDELPGELETSLLPYMRRARRVCSIGVFIPEYGFRHVAEAVEQVRRETREDVGLVLLDGTFASDETYRAEVLRGRAEWMTVLRNVPHPHVFQILKRSDAFVRATEREGYGLSRVEALWCGLPVVATKAGETRGMLLYDFGDVEGLTQQLRRALFDPPTEDVRAWGEHFRREAEENLRNLTRALLNGA